MNIETQPARRLAVVGVPSAAGARRTGQEEAPRALRAAGLIDSLRQRGFDVLEQEDLPSVAFLPDPRNPRRQNLVLVAQVARAVAVAVERASDNGCFPVVLGGDCTIALGVTAGLLAERSRLGLLYFDGDLDLNTPATTPSGIFDGMVTAHLLGRGEQELARLGPRCPLVEEADLVYFGFNVAGGGIDAPELAALARSAAPRFPVEAIREDPAGAAREALAAFDRGVERILVHFDIDVTDTSAVDVPHAKGLSLDGAVEALQIFMASPKCAGLVLAEFNPELDADGSVARRLVALLAKALGALPRRRG